METKGGYEIKLAHIAYVPPFPKDSSRLLLRTEVLREESKTTEYLFEIFDAAFDHAKIEIHFRSDDKQYNPVRESIMSVMIEADKKKIANVKKLCQRLHQQTDNRNGNGLFVIIEGQKGLSTRLVLMRFKGEEGLVSRNNKRLVDYMSEVFSRKSTHYKLAAYEEQFSEKSFWRGWSVDKQISGTAHKPISQFWISEFLDSETALTPSQGTMQFSKVLKEVLNKTRGLTGQEEIVHGLMNLRAKKARRISLSEFCENYLSPETRQQVKECANEKFFDAIFDIDSEVYRKEFGRTVLSLENGITAYVPTFSYERHVKETTDNDGSKKVTIEAKLNSKKINVQTK